MRFIDFSKQNDNEVMYIDQNNYLNIYNFDDNALIYTSENVRKFEQTAYSFDDQHIILVFHSQDYYFLRIIPRRSVINNHFMLDTICSFSTSGEIISFHISPNKNRVAIIFTVNDIYFDTINGKYNPGVKNVRKQFLHVYEYTNEGTARLILNKIYPEIIKIDLSELDTIAITSIVNQNVDPDNIHSRLEIYDLTNKKRILKKIFNYFIKYLQFFPENDTHNNNIIIITKNLENDDYNIRLIDLKNKFEEKINLPVNFADILSIDINKKGAIALRTDNGILYMPSLTSGAIHLFPNKVIFHSSFSISGDKIAVIMSSDQKQNEHGFSKYFAIYNLDDGAEIFDSYNMDEVLNNYFDTHPQIEYIKKEHEDNELVIRNPFLDKLYVDEIPTDQEKLQQHSSENCFNVMELSEENIGNYLSSDPDNLVIFFKNPDDAGFQATCLNFKRLNSYLKNPNHIFYKCVDELDYRAYRNRSFIDEFLKIPTHIQTLFVKYGDIRQKYDERQNMIFLEHSEKIEKTISFNASFTLNFLGSNHCQKGSDIDVYNIIF